MKALLSLTAILLLTVSAHAIAPAETLLASKTWSPSFNTGSAASEIPRKCMIRADAVEDTVWGPVVNGKREKTVQTRPTQYLVQRAASADEVTKLIEAAQNAKVDGRPGRVDLAKITYNGFVGANEEVVMLRRQQVGLGAGWNQNTSPGVPTLLMFIDTNCP